MPKMSSAQQILLKIFMFQGPRVSFTECREMFPAFREVQKQKAGYSDAKREMQ